MLRFYATSMNWKAACMHGGHRRRLRGQNVFNSLPRKIFCQGKTASAARKWINSACPQTDATTFAFASLSILLLCGGGTEGICTMHNAHVSGLKQQNTFPLCFPACCNFFRGVQGYLYMQKFSRRICVQSQQRTDQQNLDFFHRSSKLKRRQKRSANMASVSKILE